MKVHFIFSLIFFSMSAVSTQAQQWQIQDSGFTIPLKTIVDLSVADTNTAWAMVKDTIDNPSAIEFTRTVDGGLAWISGVIVPNNKQVYSTSISAVSNAKAWAMVVYDPFSTDTTRIFHTSDGGDTWAPQPSAGFDFSVTSMGVSLHFFDELNGVAYGRREWGTNVFGIYTTSNGGQNWEMVPVANIPLALEDAFQVPERPKANFATHGNTIWIPTDFGRVFKSTDRGLTWTVSQASTTPPTILQHSTVTTAVAFADPLHGLLMYGIVFSSQTTLHRTTDGGQTWIPVSFTGPIKTQDMAAIPGLAGTYVSVGGTDWNSGSSYTTDAGQTWTQIDQIPHRSVGFASVMAGFAGGTSGPTGGGGVFKFDPGTLLGTGNSPEGLPFSIYPNPCRNTFRLQNHSECQNESKSVILALHDITGRLVLSRILCSEQELNQEIQVKNLQAGMYLLRISVGGKHLQQKLLIE